MGQNRVEKIAERYARDLESGHSVQAGDFLKIRPHRVLTHDNTGAVIPKFKSLGADKVLYPSQPVFALDHDVQNRGEKNLAKYQGIEDFAEEHGIAFHPAGYGIGHQIMVEEGFVLPGTFAVASDSHSNIYGALAALGTPVVRTDAAAIWATGETWWQVPEVIRVSFSGTLRPGVSGKDLIIALIGHFNHDEALNCAVEFDGPGVAQLSMDQRLTISNMSTEWGALAGVFPFDAVTRDYLTMRAEVMKARGDVAPRITPEIIERVTAEAPTPDPDAYYGKEISFDLGSVTPYVAGPGQVKLTAPLAEVEAEQIKVHKAYLLSCVNGRYEDMAAAAEVLKGNKVADGVKLYVAAASAFVEERARKDGHWQVLLDAGAIAFPPGCGACIGLGEGLLESGEVGISATNRNFKGRMGAADAKVYLASPAVVAASAIKGHIAGPTAVEKVELRGSCETKPKPAAAPVATAAIEGFPAKVEGRLLLMPADNLNTDGIYGKEYTYQDDLTPEQMATKAMLNHDPKFQEIARDGDIIVGGFNFGSGSSREQAATALKFRGVQMVIGGSFSQTYKRNAFNNGFIVLECPELVEALRARFADSNEATIDTGVTAAVDFAAGELTVEGKGYRIAPLGLAAQELIVAGGLEARVRQQLMKS